MQQTYQLENNKIRAVVTLDGDLVEENITTLKAEKKRFWQKAEVVPVLGHVW